MMNGCGSDKKIEHKAWLQINFFDKSGNEIFEGRPSINYYGRKNVDYFFEFVSNNNSIKQCNKRIKHIIKNKNDKFRISMAAYHLFLKEDGTDEELKNFRSIHSMKFQCNVARKEPSRIGEPLCVAGYLEKFLRKKKPPNYDRLTDAQKKEIVEESFVEALMFTDGVNGFGMCQQEIIEKKPEIYFIKDIL